MLWSFLISCASAQVVIWSEGFDAYANGSMSANDNNLPVGPDWSIGACVSCASDPADWWEVQSFKFEARDVNNETPFLKTELIDISGFTSVSFSVLVTETGDHEGIYLNSLACIDQDNEDFADVSFRLDGGPWLKIINYLNWCGLYNSCGMHTLMGDEGSAVDCRSSDTDWVSANVSVGGLSGNTIEILLEARNSAGTEYIQFDNIQVQGFMLLPVKLTDFNAVVKGENVELTWQTHSEINNDYFEIQRSSDLQSWTSLGQIRGAGTSNEKLEYQFIDQVGNGIERKTLLYYRLLQVDFNGSSEYSEIITAEFSAPSSVSISVSPNPVGQSTRVSISSPSIQKAEIHIYSLTGQLIHKEPIQLESGLNFIELNTSSLESGTYILRAVMIESTESIRLQK